MGVIGLHGAGRDGTGLKGCRAEDGTSGMPDGCGHSFATTDVAHGF